jgi:competence ComEA-like helix-hairpin-helix protein
MLDGAIDRLTPLERRALSSLAAAWLLGAAAGALGLDARLAAFAAHRLDPPLPTPVALAARLPAHDPRPLWYAAALALQAEKARARQAPAPLDPNTATRADWDRLPGIGPRLAGAIVGHRAKSGPFRGPEDLLAVRGIGPRTLERLDPYLRWQGTTPGLRRPADTKPDLNDVDESFLAAVPGIGPKLAATIVRERRRGGGFRAWADVLRIQGIGASRLRALQNAVRLARVRPATGGADTMMERT